MTHPRPIPATRRLAGVVVPLATALLLGLAPARATAQSTPALQRARGFLATQNWSAAEALLDSLTAAEPDNARAWSFLGYAYHSEQKWDQAIAAHQKAAQFPATRPTALYNLGAAYARKGNPDEAFHWFQEALETHQMDMTRLVADPDAASLRNDPRYLALMPDDAELAHPFLEDVHPIREWIGEETGSSFGWIARDIGDVDGDGIHDVTTSAPVFGGRAGRVYVFSSATGALLWSTDGSPGDQLGLGIEAAGDVDGDGTPDVVAGAPFGDYALVLSGLDGRVIHRIEARQAGEAFGRKTSDVGDLDGDGHDDVFVGAPLNDAVAQDAGAAYVFSGADGSLLLELHGESAGDQFGSTGAGADAPGGGFLVIGAPNAGNGGRTYVYRGLSETPAFTIEADATGAQLGAMFVSVVGDVDADGTPDIYASDWANGALGPSTGRVYVHSGKTGERLYTLTGEAAGDGFGIGVADAGDVDGDGHADLVIGAWQHASAAPGGGKVYLYSGRDGSLLGSVTADVMGETFGFDATGVGDVDGDGTPDLLLTSAWSSVAAGPRTGRMFIFSGRDFLPGGGGPSGGATTGNAMAPDPSSAALTYDPAPGVTRTLKAPSGLEIRVRVEPDVLGGDEVELAEITFPPGSDPSRGHVHGSTEIFYVLDGVLDHEVNGKSHRLEPGGVGIVRPGDQVIHRVLSDGPVRALVIWAPGGEVARLVPAFSGGGRPDR